MGTRRRRAATVGSLALAVGVLVSAACTSTSTSATDANAPRATTAEGAVATGAPTASPRTTGMLTSVTDSSGKLSLSTLSTRADMVTGGDVVVEVRGAPNGDPIRVTLDGRDVSEQVTGDLRDPVHTDADPTAHG